ncbi:MULTISPECIES: hypothetical protein [unclassified Rathayibacter]|uniref:hypothetical protein n=1 Tax=unclassified Rathayibacter TaxID=2609250 RepID=UPI0011B0CD81|nr:MULTISPECIES: hypothetical protein [unclassified Rathayibacter]
MTSPKTVHVWLPSGRSLCDLHDLPDEPRGENEIRAARAENAAAPACGSCAVLIAALYQDVRRDVAARDAVWPAKIEQAITRLQGTGWDQTGIVDQLVTLADGAASTVTGIWGQPPASLDFESIAARRAALKKYL